MLRARTLLIEKTHRFQRFLALISLLFPCALQAQSTPVVLPLDYSGRHLYIAVTDDHLGPLTLMLDTGFQRTTLSSQAAGKGEVHTHFWQRSLSYNGFGNGAAKRRYQTAAISLRSGSTHLFTGSALVTDLGDFSQRLGHPIDGFLGWDFFRQWCATLDYSPARLTLRDPSHCTPPEGPYASLHADWNPQGLLIPAQLTFLNGPKTPALLHFDTGSDITLLLNTQFRAPAGLDAAGTDDQPPSAQESHGFGVNGRYTTDLVSVAKVDLAGQLQLQPGAYATAAIARSGAFATVHWWEGPSAMKINRDGIVGNALLDRFEWTFDPAAKRIYAIPAAGK